MRERKNLTTSQHQNIPLNMIKHLNGRQRNNLYDVLNKRDGEYCYICHGKGTKHRGPWMLIVERVDNTKGYELGNIRLAHERCNRLKDPRGKGKKFESIRSVSVDEVEPKIIRSAELAKNREAEPKFRRYVIRRIRKENGVLVGELVNAGSEHSHISQQTAKRYLDKMVSSEGPLMIDESSELPMVVARSTHAESLDELSSESLSESLAGPSAV